MDLIEKRSRGHQAENLLRDPLLQEALREVGLAAHRAFERAKSDEELRTARQVLDAAERFVRMLRIAVGEGTAAARKIDDEMRQPSLISRSVRAVRNRNGEGMPWESAT